MSMGLFDENISTFSYCQPKVKTLADNFNGVFYGGIFVSDRHRYVNWDTFSFLFTFFSILNVHLFLYTHKV